MLYREQPYGNDSEGRFIDTQPSTLASRITAGKNNGQSDYPPLGGKVFVCIEDRESDRIVKLPSPTTSTAPIA